MQVHQGMIDQSFFPIKIRLETTGEVFVIASAEAVPQGVSMRILATRVPMEEIERLAEERKKMRDAAEHKRTNDDLVDWVRS